MCGKLIYLTSFVLVLNLFSYADGQPTGNILWEYWYDIDGNTLDFLRDDPRYPDSPDMSELRDNFNSELALWDNYGCRVRGYLYPPEDGDYEFWVSGDDYCELWLSTNDDPYKIIMIAEVPGWTEYLEWGKYPQQKSQPITLQADQRYYIEALMKEHEVGDHLTVGWGGPIIGNGPVIIDGAYLSPWLGWFKAHEPNPADGAIHQSTWANLFWQPGMSAVSHDVYFGDNFDNVNDGVAEVFVGNEVEAFFIVGFPGFAYPDGLVPGTTYYWRVDEVEADGTTKYKGYVWSFLVPPRTAYDPVPPDGARFVDPNVELSWAPGFGAKLHTVHFGDNFDDVNNATGGLPQGTLTYTPGPLELDKTYYWRVDQFDTAATYKGDVRSFTTTRAGGGVKADYYKGMDLMRLVLTRIDPQINFNWGGGEPNPAVGEDKFSVRWTGEIETAFTETYTFYTNSSDGVRLWIDGQLLIDNWTDHETFENSREIDLIAGKTFSVVMEYYEARDDAVAELRWSSPSTPKQLIPQAAFLPPVEAGSPSPSNYAADVKHTRILKWSAGDAADSHQVYFGTDEEAVKNANAASPEYQGTRDLGSESYDPGQLEWNTTYYWRVDEVNNINPDSPWIGDLWSFTTANFLVVDDFEAYNDISEGEPASNRIYLAWSDGYNDSTNGALVGHDNPPLTEQTIVNSGNQSMPMSYNNAAGKSEATFVLTYPRDWTEKDVNTLTIWFRGNPAAFAEEPTGTFTMSGAGTDIAGDTDEFRYAYKQLSGDGEIVARVISLQNTNDWAKAGVMIRETLKPGSKHAFACITPRNGVAFQNRKQPNSASSNSNTRGFAAPYWVKLVRQGSLFTAYHSDDGVNWVLQEPSSETANPETIAMPINVYIGLALTSHNSALTCVAEFSDVRTTGSVSPMLWNHEAIGAAMTANDPESMYVALNGNAT
jgi:hypothetical protein